MPRLYDLVRVKDDRVRVAFYFALRDTLVANDLKQATDIAYQVNLLTLLFPLISKPEKMKNLFLLFVITVMLSSMCCICNGNHSRMKKQQKSSQGFPLWYQKL